MRLTSALFWVSCAWSTCVATPTPPSLAKDAAVSSTVPMSRMSVTLPGEERPVTYTTAPASARHSEMPLPIPRLAPVMIVTNPESVLCSAEPQMRTVLTMPSAGTEPGAETPGMLLQSPFSIPSGGCSGPCGGTFRSAFGRKAAHLARARTSRARSAAWRASSSASRADLRPVSLSSFRAYALATVFNALAWPLLSSNSLKSATASCPAFRAPSASFCMTWASASVCSTIAWPFLLPASFESDTPSVAFSTAPLLSLLARWALATCLHALPLTALSLAAS
mmetsp:Transcript_135702/g.378020  ORF Transcript_135702/g.378020 Transcript_135702/m.378020 type:complete len:280 (-) Transcript_135702:452-1291(-)